MNAIAHAQSTFEYSIKILSGSDKGVQYKIVSSKVIIGRSNECDIVLSNDSKISRRHAEITFNNEGIQIVELSRRDRLLIEGHATSSAYLQNGTVVKLGDTKFQFIVNNALANIQKPELNSINSGLVTKNKKKPMFYILVGGIILLFAFLMLDSGKKKNNQLKNINDSEIIKQKAEKNQKIIEAYKKQKKMSGQSSSVYFQAQTSFLKGFREYEYGNYNRALDSFQSCLSIDPTHTLCERYKNLSKRKFNELIQYKMILGRNYKDQNQYSACKKIFENIMFMIQDRTNEIYIEAKDNYNVCNTILKGQF